MIDEIMNVPVATMAASDGDDATGDPTSSAPPPVSLTILAHIQHRGDVTGPAGSWVGDDAMAYWVEGFSLSLNGGIEPISLVYRALLFDGSITPWVTDREFCGTRSQGQPLLGFQVQLRGAAELAYDCFHGARFTDGKQWAPSAAGTICVAASRAPLAAIWVDVRPKAGGMIAEPKPAPKRSAAKIEISGIKSVNSMRGQFSIFRREASPRLRFPAAAYPTQDFYDIAKGYHGGSHNPLQDFQERHALQFDMHMIEDGYFCVGSHIDGMILDNNLIKIDESASFCWPEFSYTGFDLRTINIVRDEIDQAFVSSDAAWGNYFHFLAYLLSRAHVADFYIDDHCKIVIPEYGNRPDGSVPVYSKATYDQAIAVSGLRDRITPLPTGIYPCKKIYFIGSNPGGPTEFCKIPQFYHIFSKIKATLKPSNKFSKRILISRKLTHDQRISDADYEFVRKESLSAGYQELYLENLSFQDQVDAFFNAESVIAPHGAGLANLLFGRRDLSVLELARELDGDGSVRACFFQFASMLGQKYHYLNATKGDLTPEKFKAAMRLISPSRD
jgi:hypothetical protein